MFKLGEDPLQCRVYLLNFMNDLKIILSQLKQTCMLLMDYLYIRGEDLPYYVKHDTWNLLNTYIDAHIQKLIDEYTGARLQIINRYNTNVQT